MILLLRELLLAFVAVFTIVFAATAAPSRIDFTQKRNQEGGSGTNTSVCANWPRDKVFFSAGDDVLSWGSVSDYIDVIMRTKPVTLPHGATLQDLEKTKRFNEQKIAKSLAARYLGGALLAQLAKRAHVDIAKSRLTATGIVEKLVASFPEKYRTDVRTRLLGPDGYIAACVTNTLLSDAYVEGVIKPSVVVTAGEVSEAMAARRLEIQEATKSNVRKKDAIAKLLGEIRSGKVQFERAAELLSQCVSSDRKGYWGKFGERSSDLLPEIKAVVFALPTNAPSDVVETPFSFHIFKVASCRPPFISEEEAEELEDGEEEEGEKFVHLSHIMVEKEQVPKALDETSARDFVFAEKVKAATNEAKSFAFTNLDVQCVFPMKLKEERRK